MTKLRIHRHSDDVKPQGYYVYVHLKETTGEVFYVGKGTKGRLISTHCRSSYWRNVAKKHGVIAKVVMDNLTECCSFTLEKIIIGKLNFDGVPIVNLTEGGEGSSGYKMTPDQRQANRDRQIGLQSGEKNGMWGKTHSDEVKALLSKLHTGRKASPETRKRMSDCRKGPLHPNYGKTISDDQKKKLSENVKNRPRGSRHPKYDHAIREFFHKDGREFIGTQREFINKYSLSASNVCTMIKTGKGSVKGWRLAPPD